MKTKICTKCGIEKKLSEFYKHLRGKFSVRSKCISCMKNYQKENKTYIKKRNKSYYKCSPWKLTLLGINSRCNNKNHPEYKDYGGRGIKCLITVDELKKLWFKDKAYSMNKPSINRKDNDGNYCIENCEYIELKYNIGERNKRVSSKPILQFDLQGNFIKEWPSTLTASKTTKLATSCIHHNLSFRSKTAGGFIWKYK